MTIQWVIKIQRKNPSWLFPNLTEIIYFISDITIVTYFGCECIKTFINLVHSLVLIFLFKLFSGKGD